MRWNSQRCFRLPILLLGLAAAGCDNEAAKQQLLQQQQDFARLEQQHPDLDLALGKRIFERQCLVCHQRDGQGSKNAIPPLVEHAPMLASKSLGKAYLARLVLYGQSGSIEVRGKTYFNAMPALGALLNDEQVATVLNYVLLAWGNDSLTTPAMLMRAADVQQQRLVARRAADNLAFRRQVLAGAVAP